MHFHRSEIGVALIGAVAVAGLLNIALPAFAVEREQDGRTLVRAGEKDNLATQRAGGGCPGAEGDCCIPHDTPGCNDEKCCQLVCFSNFLCCEQPWGADCVELAERLCEIYSGGGGEGPPIGCEDDGDCDDGDPCTIDSCNVDTGECSNEELDCDDGDQCTADFCIDGACLHEDNGECCEGCGTCAGDVNCSGDVDPLDSGAILARFGLDPCNEELCQYDVNCDGAIDPLDSGFVLARFGVCNEPEVCKICSNSVFNDNCEDAPVDTLNVGETLSYDGVNTDATSTCGAIGWPETWHAFELTETADVTTSLCGTDPPFGDASIILDQSCPCSALFIWVNGGFDQTACGARNWTMYYNSLPAGVYYSPVQMSTASTGEYTWNISALEGGGAP